MQAMPYCGRSFKFKPFLCKISLRGEREGEREIEAIGLLDQQAVILSVLRDRLFMLCYGRGRLHYNLLTVHWLSVKPAFYSRSCASLKLT